MSKQTDQLIAKRDALARQWQSNVRDRARIEIELDRVTTLLGEQTGLALPLLDMSSLFAGGLGSRRSARRRI